MRTLDLIPSTPPASTTLPAGVPPVDAFVGCLLGVGIGDALGRPAEAQPPDIIRERFGSLTDFRPWRGWTSGPIGTVTDDTQMTMCIAESIVATGGVDPDDVADRFVAWLPQGRGKGRTCTQAVLNLQAGSTWDHSGVRSAGNGAAMRVAPVGLLHARRAAELRRDAAITAVITHADPMAVVSAVAQATAVAWLTHTSAGQFSPDRMLSAVDAMIGDLPDPGARERRPGAGRGRVKLRDRLMMVADLLDATPSEAFSRLHNGAFVLESLPSSWWCFLRFADDPERVLVTAANGGYDADTVASMAGALCGALHGRDAFPDRWRDQLEFRDELTALARHLHRLATAPVAVDVDWRPVLAFLPQLRAQDFRAGEWDPGTFVRTLYDQDVIIGFDWPAWKQSRGRELYDDPRELASADLDDLRRMLTTLVRQDRFVEGLLLAEIENGFVTRILERVAEIIPDQAPADPSR